MATDIKSLPFRILTDRSLRPVRHLILVAAILTIAISQNMSYYGARGGIPVTGVYLLSLITAAAYLSVAYLHIYVLVPGFMARNDYASYFLASFSSLVVLWGVRLGQNLLARRFWGTEIDPFRLPALLDSFSDLALNTLCFTGVSLTVMLKYWLGEKERIARLESGRAGVELAALRGSIDSDMLQGTLERCAADSRTAPADSASMILKLSELLRYQLYESAREKVLLDSEVGFIRGCLELEKQRTPGFEYSLTVDGNPIVYTAPLRFMPLIKTAMKNRNPGQKLEIHIDSSEAGISLRSNCLSGVADNELQEALTGLIYGDKTHLLRDGADGVIIHIGRE